MLIGHDGQVVYRKAYGKRALVPAPEAMTVDTIFDLRLAHQSGRHHLLADEAVRAGQVPPQRQDHRLHPRIPGRQERHHHPQPVHAFFRAAARTCRSNPPWTGYETGIRLACTDPPAGPPGVRFVYSDINFILLGELVHRLSGQMLSDYAREHIFLPLGMKETMFQPPAALVPRIAPTERVPEERPAAARRGARPDRALHGRRGRARRPVLHRRRPGALRPDDARTAASWTACASSARSPSAKFTEPQSPPDQPILRGLGWDIDSPYSGNRGELFPIGSYGHTGFHRHFHLDRSLDARPT